MDSSIIKKIEIEKKFATAVYKNFMSLRFGMDTCCLIDMESAAIKKELCDWDDRSLVLKTASEELKTKTRDIIVCQTPTETGVTSWTSADIDALIKRIEILETTALEDEKDLSYVHDQPTASTTWIINHNLNKKPSVRLEDLTGADIMGEIDYTNNNTVRIQFAIPVAGTAYLN